MPAAVISPNANTILNKRYLAPNETIEGMFRRVANGNEDFYQLMVELRFLPNSPTLFNAGLNNGCTSSACFVFDVEDSMFGENSIDQTRSKATAVAKAGGGVGYYFGKLRSKGSPISSVHRKACGPIAVLKDYHGISRLITQGGKRELAQMGVLPVWHDDIREFIHVKDEDPQGLGSFNISVSWTDEWIRNAFQDRGPYPSAEEELWNEQCQSAWRTGCPGMFFPDTVNRANPNKHLGLINAPNPCLTAETLVAVADGRGSVSIGELASSGDDVPVYCADDKGGVTVRMMRHPRLTGVRQPIYKVTLDNGGSIRVTGNHKFLLRTNKYRIGQYVRVTELKEGDSLAILTRYIPEQCSPESQSRADRYIGFSFRGCTAYEHDLIAEFSGGGVMGDHVHHCNGNRLDNRPENLEYQNAHDHLSEHSRGVNNGNSTGVTNKELLVQGRKLVRSLGRRFSSNEWEEYARGNGLPTVFSEWRRKSLGTVLAFSRKCAELENMAEHANHNPKLVRTYQEALDAGLEAEIVDNKVLVERICEACGDPFTVNYFQREHSFCSIACANTRQDKTKMIASLAVTNKRRQDMVREQQVEVYLSLRTELARQPMKKEWIAACRKEGVSAEMSRKSSPFRYWEDLVEAANTTNHKVVWVERDGWADVYNGTVDDFHNFFVGGWDEGINAHGRRRIVYLLNPQCGETPNRNNEPCNLGSLSLPRYWLKGQRGVKAIDLDRLANDARIATRFLDDILDRNVFPHPDITAAALLTRKLGLGVMGWADLLALCHIHYDTEEAVELGRDIMSIIGYNAERESVKMAGEKGPYAGFSEDKTDAPMARNETRTSIAPTGTIAIIADVWGSIDPHFALDCERTTSEGLKLKDGIAKWVAADLDGFIPKSAHQVAPEWHVKHQAAFQAHIDLGVSKTINLPKSAIVEDVSRIYRLMYESGCKGGTVFRDGCRDEQVLVSKKTSSVYLMGNGQPAVQPKQRKLPSRRPSETIKLRVAGVEIFLIVGFYPGTQELGEIFVEGNFGTTVAGLLNSFAINFSVALQNGTPLQELINHHKNKRFEPCGLTDNKDVPHCTSIPDLIVRILEKYFLKSDKPEQEKPVRSGIFCPDCGSEAILLANCLTCVTAGCGWSRC